MFRIFSGTLPEKEYEKLKAALLILPLNLLSGFKELPEETCLSSRAASSGPSVLVDCLALVTAL